MGADAGLLAQIEADVLDDAPLAAALRKCVALGGQTGSADLREWATRELRGYPVADLPDYRKITCALYVDAIVGNFHQRGRQISPRDLPDFTHDDLDETVMLNSGVGEIEGLIEQARLNGNAAVKLSVPMAMDLAKFMDSGQPHQQTLAIYWQVSVAALVGVLDQVRTTLIELVAEMRAGTPGGAGVPSAAVAAQAFNFAVRGIGSRVTITAAQASGQSTSSVKHTTSEPEGFFSKLSHRVWAAGVGVATIGATFFAYLEYVRAP